jgi:hypothetical protein
MTVTTLNLPLLSDVTLPQPKVYPASFFAPPSLDPPTPLTPVVKKAEELIKATLPNWAVNHSYRVYAFGLALTEHAGWTKAEDWDVEVSLFHLVLSFSQTGTSVLCAIGHATY